MRTRSLVILALLTLTVDSAGAEPVTVTEADVCVYGGTSGGVIAAVQAARLGKKVVLVEPGRQLGGMSSSGLGWTDNGSTETISGLSREFYQRVYRYYTKPAAWQFQKREDYLAWLPKIWGVDGPRMEELKAQFLFEPHAAEHVFNEMARAAGVQVVYGERLDLKHGVRKDGAKITRVVMVSDYVVTENDARGNRVAKDAVALASYPLDSHGVTLYVDENGVLHRERGFFVGIKPFPIKYKVIASPTYWEERATPDRKCSGDNVRSIIRNFVRAAK